MAENRDFLAESNQLRAEADEIWKTLVSKTTPNGLLEEIAKEMRMIRREMKENQEKNEKKFEEFKVEMKMEILEEIRKNQQLQDEKMDKISKELAKCVPKSPIREAILGEWKMVDHENFEGYEEAFLNTFEDFSANLKYELENGKLKEIEVGFPDLIEGGGDDGEKKLYEEENHFKSFWGRAETIDRYIEDGKLYYFQTSSGTVWHRVFVKV